MFEYRNDVIYFTCHESNDGIKKLLYNGKQLNFLNQPYFSFSEINDPFNPKRDEIIFNPEITKICFKIFDTVKEMYEKGIDERPSSILVATLFETFASYWSRVLLSHNKDRIGIVFWRKVLKIVKDWKTKNPGIFIHTGTPYYFLAENYFMVDDYDSGFTYLHNALKIDEQSWQWDYEGHIGAYSLAKMIDDPRTQMNYLTKDIRCELDKFIQKFNEKYGNISLEEIDNKFLKNENKYHILGYFFTVTFYIIIHNQRNAQLESPENYFSKLRSLDMVFNLCLIIDKILKRRFFQDMEFKQIPDGIAKLCELNGWVDYIRLHKDWARQSRFDETNPKRTIPLLLMKNEKYGINKLPIGVYSMMLAHYCRNLGAHTLNENSIFVENHDMILNDLMMALFLSIKSIN